HPSWSEFTAILINTGNDTFNDVYSNGNNNDGTDNTILSTRSGSASWCDYDKDGDLDFWINGIHTYEPYNYYCTAEIYKNNSSISNTSPTPPTNLYSSLNGNDVTLHWNTSTDAETPQNGLSYNLYIGTASGSCNILSPMSNTSNGYRKVSKRGNVDQINSWTIKDLPDGIYFYSVQAIDHVFAGSSFSPECIFVKGYTVLPENTSIVVGAGSEIRFFEGSETNCASNTILTIQDDGSLYSDGASITGDNADTWQGIVAEIGSSIILTHSVVKNAETGLYATAANVNVTFTSFESCQNGINLVNCNDLDSKSFMLYNNTFTGFGIGSGVSLTISDGTFSGNTIENFYSGVRFTLCSPTVTKNEIYDNRRFGIFIFGHNAFPQLVLNSKIGGRNNSIINNGSVNTSPSPFPFPDAQIGIMPFGNVYLTGGMNNIHSGQTNTTPQIPCISVSPRTIEIPPLQPTEILIEASSNYWGSEYVSNNFFSLAWNYIIDYTPWAIDPYTDEPGPPPSYSSNEPPSTESILLSNAMFLEDKENFTASIKQYEHVIKKYVDTPEYYVALARLPYVYLKAGLETQPLINTYDDGLLSENTSQKKFFKEMKISTHIKGRNYDTAIALAEEMKAEAQSEDEILLAEIDIAVCNVMKESEGNGKSTHYASETLRNLLSKLNGADDKVEPTGITESVLPTECKLYQNYPNPFNPVTQIKFALKNTSDVKLSVYNISGQKVAELANGTRQSGVHTVDFDGSKLNSGIFYYMLETDNQTLTKKMVLTK
ncbi:MAG: T9SS type A sorting domain-containing protein, partial [Candidatus Delongbacteria bacterium]|nr:T9SS type A sorting domain-containing protein [Candidatus Delongbacteria bacterium]